ncbi:MAG: hypothetical protein OXE78_11030, partial [Gammaproteobacteria bacterium]|nr:hypothetical protein [Gammaproteobacteria bacterium]
YFNTGHLTPVKVGFDRSQMTSVEIAAVVDESIFPSAANDEAEDYGRKPTWHVYVAAEQTEQST